MNRNLLAIQVMETAIDLPSDEQDAYVQSACDGDSTLLRKVRALLNAAEDETGFLATRSDYSDNEVPPPRERIGDYRIIREIGRGGMGIVYEAEHDAMQRRVALKVLSAGSSPSEKPVSKVLSRGTCRRAATPYETSCPCSKLAAPMTCTTTRCNSSKARTWTS